MKRHFDTEDYIIESGLNYILFRNILYMHVLPLYLGDKYTETGINLPAGDGRVSFALRSEMGEAIANVLLEDDCNNKIYDFTGAETYSFNDVAKQLSILTGKEIKYKPINEAEYAAPLKAKGMSDFFITMMTGFMSDIKNEQESTVSKDMENKLGRKPASLKDGLKLIFHL